MRHTAQKMFILLLMLLLLPGCRIEFGADETKNAGTAPDPTAAISAVNGKIEGELELYLLMPYEFPPGFDGKEMPEDYYYYGQYYDLDFIIAEYRKARPNVWVKITEFHSPEDYFNTLKRDLASGGGPDAVFYIPSYYDDNFFDYAAQGWIEDLNPYIEKDESGYPLDMDDMMAPAADAFVVDGHRYAMPCTVDLDLYVTSVETLQNTELSLPKDGLSGTLLPDLLKAFAETRNDPGCRVSYNQMFFDFLRSSKTELWNTSERSAGFDNPLFLELVKKYLELIANYPIDENYYPISTEDWTENRVLFDRARTITGLTGDYAFLDNLCERTPLVFTSGTASISSIVAMNKNAKNKDTAFDFIKFAAVSAHTSSYSTMSTSKHKINECIQMLRENIKTGKALYYETNEKTFAAKRVHEEFFDSLSGIPESITSVYIPDKTIEKLIEQMLEDIQRGVSPEEAVADLQKRALEYLNE